MVNGRNSIPAGMYGDRIDGGLKLEAAQRLGLNILRWGVFGDKGGDEGQSIIDMAGLDQMP